MALMIRKDNPREQHEHGNTVAHPLSLYFRNPTLPNCDVKYWANISGELAEIDDGAKALMDQVNAQNALEEMFVGMVSNGLQHRIDNLREASGKMILWMLQSEWCTDAEDCKDHARKFMEHNLSDIELYKEGEKANGTTKLYLAISGESPSGEFPWLGEEIPAYGETIQNKVLELIGSIT